MTEPTSAAVPPDRSLEQRMDALARANAARSARAGLKRMLKHADPREARFRAIEVMRDPAPEFESMKVFDLLFAVPRFGRVKVNRILTAVRVSPSKTLGGLSNRQRDELLRAVKDAAPYYAPTGRRAA